MHLLATHSATWGQFEVHWLAFGLFARKSAARVPYCERVCGLGAPRGEQDRGCPFFGPCRDGDLSGDRCIPRLHRTVGLDGTLLVNPCHGLVAPPPDWAAMGPIQPGLGHRVG